MQLGLSLSALLSCVLLMLTTQVVEAGPLSRRSPNFVTLPLKRVELARGLHPQIVRRIIRASMNYAHPLGF
jgi:hypothetical protein